MSGTFGLEIHPFCSAAAQAFWSVCPGGMGGVAWIPKCAMAASFAMIVCAPAMRMASRGICVPCHCALFLGAAYRPEIDRAAPQTQIAKKAIANPQERPTTLVRGTSNTCYLPKCIQVLFTLSSPGLMFLYKVIQRAAPARILLTTACSFQVKRHQSQLNCFPSGRRFGPFCR